MVNVAIFASGKGSNAANICHYFKNHASIKVSCIFSDRKAAGVFEVAEDYGVESVYLSPQPPLSKERKVSDARQVEASAENILAMLDLYKISFIVLAGYLKLMPAEIINAYRNRIINIHPALLPKYGGRGMYGMRVHEAVCMTGEEETGITIHHVDEKYDEGDIIFQAKVKVERTDLPEQVAAKVHVLEMEHFPKVIEDLIVKKHN